MVHCQTLSKTVLNVGLLALLLFPSGCSAGGPSCSSNETKQLLEKATRTWAESVRPVTDPHDWEKSDIAYSNIRTDDKTDLKVVCKATTTLTVDKNLIGGPLPKTTSLITLTYEVTNTDDGHPFVQIKGATPGE